MSKLEVVAKEIRELISNRQNELGLTFEEENHIYTMDGKSDWLSVSSVIKKFYKPFPAEEISLNKAKGDKEIQKKLLREWDDAATYSVNIGSRVHYLLEKYLIEKNGDYKQIRQPIFDCDLEQLMKSDKMVEGGKKYLQLMEERGAVLLDTEMVLGDPDLSFVGQPDKIWLIHNKTKSEYGLLITDYKTNKPKSFLETKFTERMFPPFHQYPNNALGHYYLQLPLYGKLLLKMLENTKYGNLKLYGCILCHLTDDGKFTEYRVPKEIISTILEIDIKNYF
jgi:hypothetical protein